MGKYFTVKELCKSQTAINKGIDNTPTNIIVKNLNRLIDNVLDPLREAWGKPIIVNSGYRCPALNKAVGGVPTSHHLKGMAADITTGNVADNSKLFDLAITLKLPYCQLIWEKGGAAGPDWVHISYDANNIKRQILKL